MKANHSWLGVRPERITRTSHFIQTLAFCALAGALLLLASPLPAGQALDGGSPGQKLLERLRR
jgi:hypothetical protein